MIVVDTNVISAMMQNSPPVGVIRWFNRQPNDTTLFFVDVCIYK